VRRRRVAGRHRPAAVPGRVRRAPRRRPGSEPADRGGRAGAQDRQCSAPRHAAARPGGAAPNRLQAQPTRAQVQPGRPARSVSAGRVWNPSAFEDVLGKGPIPLAVRLWTQHHVSEWLRTIDLAEFTPNLMCAGVHGALMVRGLDTRPGTAESETAGARAHVHGRDAGGRAEHAAAEVAAAPAPGDALRRPARPGRAGAEARAAGAPRRPRALARRQGQGAWCSVARGTGERCCVSPQSCKRGAVRRRHRADVLADPDELVCPLTPSRRPSRTAALQVSSLNFLLCLSSLVDEPWNLKPNYRLVHVRFSTGDIFRDRSRFPNSSLRNWPPRTFSRSWAGDSLFEQPT